MKIAVDNGGLEEQVLTSFLWRTDHQRGRQAVDRVQGADGGGQQPIVKPRNILGFELAFGSVVTIRRRHWDGWRRLRTSASAPRDPPARKARAPWRSPPSPGR